MGRALSITRELQRHDRELYCAKDRTGTLCVYRKSLRAELYDIDGTVLINVRPDKHFIFALTDNWNLKGIPVDWGLEPIMARIRHIDSWNHETIVKELVESYEQDEISHKRDMSNKTEAFLKDFRRQFAKTFSDYNVSSLKKIDKRRKGEKDGYC